MQLLNETPRATNSLPATRQLSPALQQRTAAVCERYGTRGQFMTTMSPAMQHTCALNVRRAYTGHAPTLATLDLTYGDRSAVMWLMPQLHDLCAYAGARDKMDPLQAAECACVIRIEYGYLKVTEVMLFLWRVKCGRYGQFYGAVDPLNLVRWMREFLRERAAELQAIEREAEQRRREQEAARAVAIDCADYCRRHGYPPMDNVADIIRYAMSADAAD